MIQTEPQTKQETPSAAEKPAEQPEISLDDVSERPTLAPDVELSGEMQDSAFAAQQWLVQRDGQFVQLTELLYRIVEFIDGERTVDEIASEVSQATDRNVTADNIRLLIAKKLIPKGLVARADGSVTVPKTGPRSALQINARMRVVGPSVLNPLTAVFQYFYLPPVVVIALLATGMLVEWLYFVHGIAHSIRYVLYEPGLMLVLLGFIVVGTAFHELGHAAALRYGGGRVRGMGVGLYLIYPAFYTDVTENYRLPRWSRVRTDLGGFYFNLLFALAMVGLWVLTRQEYLLLVVLLIHLEILHQTLPFVRLDGYWALADVTGVPDFFSQIGPFVRSVVPLKRWQGSKMPELKLWVKVAFSLYILITVPILALMFFLMIKGVPRVLATAWDSMGNQVTHFAAAHAAGDLVGMISSAAQLAVLAFPTLGLFYVLYTVGRRLFGALWRWSKPTPARRVTGSLVTLGIASLLTYLWAPQVATVGGAASPLAFLQGRSPFVPIGPRERWRAPNLAASVVQWMQNRSMQQPGSTVISTVTTPSRTMGTATKGTARKGTTPTVGTPHAYKAGRGTPVSGVAGATPQPSRTEAPGQQTTGEPAPGTATQPASGGQQGSAGNSSGTTQPNPTSGSTDGSTSGSTESTSGGSSQPTPGASDTSPTPGSIDVSSTPSSSDTSPTPDTSGTSSSPGTSNTSPSPGTSNTSPTSSSSATTNSEPSPTAGTQ